jgi:hypothetical protein
MVTGVLIVVNRVMVVRYGGAAPYTEVPQSCHILRGDGSKSPAPRHVHQAAQSNAEAFSSGGAVVLTRRIPSQACHQSVGFLQRQVLGGAALFFFSAAHKTANSSSV